MKAAFTPRAMARWRPIAEQVTAELCDAMAERGEADLVEHYNYEIPFNVIARILGIPEEDFPRVKALAWDFARAGEKTVTDEVAARGDVACDDHRVSDIACGIAFRRYAQVDPRVPVGARNELFGLARLACREHVAHLL